MSHNYNRKSRANPQFQNWKGHCLTHITKLEVKVFHSVHSHNLTSILPFTTDVRVAVNACMVRSQICVFMANTHMCNKTCSVLSLSAVHCLLKSTSTMSRPGVVLLKKKCILPNQQQKWMKRSKWVMEDALVDDQLSLKLYIAFTLCICPFCYGLAGDKCSFSLYKSSYRLWFWWLSVHYIQSHTNTPHQNCCKRQNFVLNIHVTNSHNLRFRQWWKMHSITCSCLLLI